MSRTLQSSHISFVNKRQTEAFDVQPGSQPSVCLLSGLKPTIWPQTSHTYRWWAAECCCCPKRWAWRWGGRGRRRARKLKHDEGPAEIPRAAPGSSVLPVPWFLLQLWQSRRLALSLSQWVRMHTAFNAAGGGNTWAQSTHFYCMLPDPQGAVHF